MQHERNYDDSRLLKSNLRRLNIDPKQIYWQWAMDFCAQGLRHITMGLGGKMDGYKMRSGFQISVSSEVMAILSIAADLADLRERMAHIVLAKSTSGADITAHDLEVDGAMTAFLTDAIHPNLLQTIEGQPIFVHGGPFANIAIGQSSIIADRLGLALSDYHVTESGFGADIGYEKFWNLKCRLGGYQPSAVVIVATIRALKEHGKNTENCLKYGCANLLWHIKIVQKSGISPVVCINKFKDDKEEELNYIKRIAEGAGATAAIADHWAQGGKGATRLAKAVLAETEKPNSFAYLYDAKEPLREQIERIATGIYGSCGVTFSKKAKEKLKELEGSKLLPCIAKTHLSLTHDPKIKIPPAKWKLPIRDILTYKGAGFAVPVAGEIKLMPGTGSDPAFRRIDVDVKTGKITGLY